MEGFGGGHGEDDYAEHPTSLSEARAKRVEFGAGIWTPRDALISALRDIDAGHVKAESIAIIIVESDENGTECQYYQRCNSTLELLGMYARASQDIGRPRE